MLVYVLVLALAGVRPGFGDSHQPDDVIPRNDCFVYHDRSVQTKLSDSRHGYPESDIEEELVRRPYLRPVLYDPDSLPRPNPEYRTPYSEIGKRLHKRSYGFYPIYRQVYPYYRGLEPNPAPPQYVQRKPVLVVDPEPAHPIRPTPVPFAERKPVLVIDPKPVHPLHPSLVPFAKHKPVLGVDPKHVCPIHPSPVHHEQRKPVLVTDPKPVFVVQPKPAHLVHPKLALVVQPKNQNTVRVTKPAPTSKPICLSRKFALRRFWLNGGDCFVINPDYQKVTYAKCRYRDCSNCTQHAYNYNHKPVNKCVETFETLYIWAFCSKLTKFDRIRRVGVNLPKYCSCQTFTC